jgi:DNA-binding GntR family transcriptional regulator
MSQKETNLLNHLSLTDKIYEILKDRIIRGELENGARLAEEELASEFGVSRTPVREALNRLKTSNLVNALPRRSVYVAALKSKDIVDICDLREVLESFSIRLAISRIKEDDIGNLRQLSKGCVDAFEREDIAQCFESDSEFHLYIAKCSGNKYLVTVLQYLDDYVQFARWIGCDKRGMIQESLHEHNTLIDALSKKDLETSLRVMSDHVKRAKSHFT